MTGLVIVLVGAERLLLLFVEETGKGEGIVLSMEVRAGSDTLELPAEIDPLSPRPLKCNESGLCSEVR